MADIVATVLSNWKLLIGLFAVGVLTYWVVDERQDSDGAADTVERVGQRAETVTGGIVGAVGSLLVVLASIGLTIGGQLLETGMMLNELLGGIPVVIGHVIVSVLGYLSLANIIGLDASTYGWIVVLLTIVALIVRFSPGEAAS